MAWPVQTLIHITLTAQPHKAWGAGTVETAGPGGAGSVVVAGLGLTGVLYLGAVLSFIACSTLETGKGLSSRRSAGLPPPTSW